MSKVFLIKAASAISEIAEAAKNKMGMGDSKQYDPRKADINKNGETEAWEKAIAAKRGFKGAPKANKSEDDCPCGEPNCDCEEEGTKKEAGAVTEVVETVGKKLGLIGKAKAKGREMYDAAKAKGQEVGEKIKDTVKEHPFKYGVGAGTAVTGSAALMDRNMNQKKQNKEMEQLLEAAAKIVGQERGKVQTIKERGLIDRILNKDI